jgi:hypothetical protein
MVNAMKRRTEITDPWQISETEFPSGGTIAQKWEFFLTYSTLAPSSHNTQPWRFHIQGDHVDLYADRRQACPVVDPLDRELILSCGCALFNLRIAMLHFAALGGVEIFPSIAEVDLIARVWMGKQADISRDGRKLFGAIARRRTNRQAFSNEAIPEALLARLKAAAAQEGASLGIAQDAAKRHDLAMLMPKANAGNGLTMIFRKNWHNGFTPFESHAIMEFQAIHSAWMI